MELIVRPFVSVESTPRLRTVTPPPKVNPPAFIRWGQAAQFEQKDFRTQASQQPWRSIGSVDDPEPPSRVRLHYQCISRAGEQMIYFHPDNPDQYVVCEEVLHMRFQGREIQDEFQLRLTQRLPGAEEGSGQRPEEPPPMNELDERPEWLAWKARHGSS